MFPQVRTWSLAAVLALLVVAVVLSASCGQDEDAQRIDAQICFPERSDILVSNSDTIPNMKIVETKSFIMVSKRGLEPACEAAVAFMDQVRHHGGNAVIEFSPMVASGPTPLKYIVFHGTAVVVQPVDN